MIDHFNKESGRLLASLSIAARLYLSLFSGPRGCFSYAPLKLGFKQAGLSFGFPCGVTLPRKIGALVDIAGSV